MPQVSELRQDAGPVIKEDASNERHKQRRMKRFEDEDVVDRESKDPQPWRMDLLKAEGLSEEATMEEVKRRVPAYYEFLKRRGYGKRPVDKTERNAALIGPSGGAGGGSGRVPAEACKGKAEGGGPAKGGRGRKQRAPRQKKAGRVAEADGAKGH